MRQIYNFFLRMAKKETDYYFYCIIWLIFDNKFGCFLTINLAIFSTIL